VRTAFRTRFDVSSKRDQRDLVTPHDRAAEDRIRAHIAMAEPDSVIVGEEAGTTGAGSVVWYVDPIDGTSNFVHGLAFFSTSVAAVVDGRVVAGAVYDPVRDDLFTASLAGAWCNGRPISSVGAADEAEALLLSSYPRAVDLARDGDRALARFGTLVGTYRTHRMPGGTALALAHVAAGWADVALGLGVNPWDVAAGALIVTRAGGRYLGLRPGGGSSEPAPAWRWPGYLATVGTIDPIPSTILTAFADGYEYLEEPR
jgi:myo-inositol-1(or 4)-monophosphatase